MLVEMFTKVIGKMIKRMVMEPIVIWMELNMKDIGLKINNMEKDWKHGQMVQHIKVNMYKEKNMEKENSLGQMEVAPNIFKI